MFDRVYGRVRGDLGICVTSGIFGFKGDDLEHLGDLGSTVVVRNKTV